MGDLFLFILSNSRNSYTLTTLLTSQLSLSSSLSFLLPFVYVQVIGN